MKKTDHTQAATESEDDLRKLLHIAGKRVEPPEAMRARVFDKVFDEWQALPEASDTQHSASPRTFWPRAMPAIAASVVFAIVGMVSLWAFVLNGAGLEPVGEIVFSRGDYQLTGEQGTPAQMLSDGALVHTGASGRLEVRVLAHTHIRLDTDTQVSFGKNGELTLHQGRIYIDSPGADEGVRVTTPFAPVSDIGTQFMVRVDEALEVLVREGAVNVALAEGVVSVDADIAGASAITVSKTQEVSQRAIAADDPRWQWIHLAAANFELENSTVYAFLQWAARESGYSLVFADDHVQRSARQTRLHGKLDDVPPSEAIEAVLRTTRFGSRVNDGSGVNNDSGINNSRELFVFIKK